MKEIRRTLGDLKNMVIDAEQKDFSTRYLLPITIHPDERERIARDACGDLIVAFCKQIAKMRDDTNDWTDEEWDTFYDKCYEDIVDKASFIDFETSMDCCEGFVNTLEDAVAEIVESMAVKMYEVTVTVVSKQTITIPVRARTIDKAEDWVNNMEYSDLGDYATDDPEFDDMTVDDIDEVSNTPSDYTDYEDAVE